MAKTSISKDFYEGKGLRELTRSMMINHSDMNLSESEYDLISWGIFAKVVTMCELKRRGVSKKDLISKGVYDFVKDLMLTEMFEVKDEKLFLKSKIRNLEKDDEDAMMFLSIYKNLFYSKYKFPPEILKTQYAFIKANVTSYKSKGEILEYLNIYFDNEIFNTKFFNEAKHPLNYFFGNINKIKEIYNKENNL